MHSLEGVQITKHTIVCKSNSSINNASFHPSGGLLVLGCRDDAIRIVDPRSESSGIRTPTETKIEETSVSCGVVIAKEVQNAW